MFCLFFNKHFVSCIEKFTFGELDIHRAKCQESNSYHSQCTYKSFVISSVHVRFWIKTMPTHAVKCKWLFCCTVIKISVTDFHSVLMMPASWLVTCAGNSPVPVNSPHQGQWRGALMFSLICVWINGWINNREAGDLRRQRGHNDFNVMCCILPLTYCLWNKIEASWENVISDIARGFPMGGVIQDLKFDIYYFTHLT